MIPNLELIMYLTDFLGKRWVVPVLILIFMWEEATFTQIKKELNVTSRSLSKKLKLLESVGLVEKIVLDNPRKIFYTLSNTGEEISEGIMRFSSAVAKRVS
ncbi:winged helix-turn-helix transcriptional regulator [Candidatus Woesearchaeota archaeon]|nr:winged helix-turn-helix transcriptional regulator [Candidatus Woesearchaeota archaeon]